MGGGVGDPRGRLLRWALLRCSRCHLRPNLSKFEGDRKCSFGLHEEQVDEDEDADEQDEQQECNKESTHAPLTLSPNLAGRYVAKGSQLRGISIELANSVLLLLAAVDTYSSRCSTNPGNYN